MRLKLFLLSISLGLTLPQAGNSASYGGGLENSQWYLASSIFECSLTHHIPRFGTGVFFHEAGESLLFYFDAPRMLLRAGQAALVVEAPAWRPGAPVQDLGSVVVVEAERPVTVDSRRATIMMDSLLSGMAPAVTRQALYTDETVKISVSPINFEHAYKDYLTCVSGLLPMNFRQVERSILSFATGGDDLSEDATRRLDDIILYVKSDPSVTGVLVDGHSDSYGRRITNRQLSKDRAEVVARYLVDGGLNEEMITVRYHGDRYPIVDNRTEANRKKNRRATVRLERRDPDQSASQLEAMPSFPQ